MVGSVAARRILCSSMSLVLVFALKLLNRFQSREAIEELIDGSHLTAKCLLNFGIDFCSLLYVYGFSVG